jgi:hypothetical protein
VLLGAPAPSVDRFARAVVIVLVVVVVIVLGLCSEESDSFTRSWTTTRTIQKPKSAEESPYHHGVPLACLPVKPLDYFQFRPQLRADAARRRLYAGQ